MTETTASTIAAEQQKSTAAFFSTVFHSGAEPVLKAQADLLASFETSVTAWLRRRHEAVTDTQALVARLRTSSDPAEVASAQQEWVAAAVRRLSADTADFQNAAQHFARSLFPQAVQAAQSVEHGAVDAAGDAAAAARAAGKQLRVANKAGE